jgi:indole-3-glycerol phosphate synthase
MRVAEDCGATLIGVNNRNLHTFEVSLDVSARLIERVSGKALLVSESGITNGSDIKRLWSLGYEGFLIGEPLMRAPRPSRALKELLSEARDDAEQADPRTALSEAGISQALRD